MTTTLGPHENNRLKFTTLGSRPTTPAIVNSIENFDADDAWASKSPHIFSATTRPNNFVTLKKTTSTTIFTPLDDSQRLKSSLGTFSDSTIVQHSGRIKRSNDTENRVVWKYYFRGVESTLNTSDSTNVVSHTDPTINPGDLVNSPYHRKTVNTHSRDIKASPTNAVGNYTAASPSAEVNRTTPATDYAPQSGYVENSSAGKFIITENTKEIVDGSKQKSTESTTNRSSLKQIIKNTKFNSKEKIEKIIGDASERHKQISNGSAKQNVGLYAAHAKQTRVTGGASPAGRVSFGQGDDDDRHHSFSHTKSSLELVEQQHSKAGNTRHALTSFKGAY